MTQHLYAELFSLLESELEVQRRAAATLEAALASAASRDLEALEHHVGGFEEITRRARDLASRRQAWLARAGAAPLSEIARRPGAPAAALARLRDELRDAVQAASSRIRRLQAVARELADVYGTALAALVAGRAEAAPASTQGSFVNTEA